MPVRPVRACLANCLCEHFTGETLINIAIRRPARSLLTAAVCTAALATGLSACGTAAQLSAADKVSKAFGKLGDGKSFKIELSLDATPDQIVAFDKANGERDPIKQKDATALAGLTLAFSVSADKPLKELDSFKKVRSGSDLNSLSGDKSLNLSYVLADKSGKTYVDLRQVDARTYLKVDAEALATLAGQDPAEVRAMSDELPAEMKVVKDALSGKWISIDPKAVEQLTREAGGTAPKTGASPSAQPSADPSAVKELGASVTDVLSRDVTFEDKGTKDGADHIVVSAPARKLADDLLNSFKPFAKKLPQLGGIATASPTGVPDRKIAVDLFLKNGAMSSLAFDVAQLDPKAGPDVHLPVKVAFSQDAATTQAPSGATELSASDLDGIMRTIAGMNASKGARPGLGKGSAVTLTAAQIAELKAGGMTDDEIKNFTAAGLGFDDLKSLLAAQG